MNEDYFPELITITCYDWLPLIKRTEEKEIIINSLRYLCQQKKIRIYAFVLMDNHFHLIWRIRQGYKYSDVQRDFLKHTAKQIIKNIQAAEDKNTLEKIAVNLKDRKFQIWQRNSLSIELRSKKVFDQKLKYIHNNLIKAKLCILEEDYKYSSSRHYILNRPLAKII